MLILCFNYGVLLISHISHRITGCGSTTNRVNMGALNSCPQEFNLVEADVYNCLYNNSTRWCVGLLFVVKEIESFFSLCLNQFNEVSANSDDYQKQPSY